jgi:hypothetical protein
MSDRMQAPGNADDPPGREPDVADEDEIAAKMAAVMRAQESTGKAGWIPDLRSRTQIPALAPAGRPLSPGRPAAGGAGRAGGRVRAWAAAAGL